MVPPLQRKEKMNRNKLEQDGEMEIRVVYLSDLPAGIKLGKNVDTQRSYMEVVFPIETPREAEIFRKLVNAALDEYVKEWNEGNKFICAKCGRLIERGELEHHAIKCV